LSALEGGERKRARGREGEEKGRRRGGEGQGEADLLVHQYENQVTYKITH
jgi:hypothetical protein